MENKRKIKYFNPSALATPSRPDWRVAVRRFIADHWMALLAVAMVVYVGWSRGLHLSVALTAAPTEGVVSKVHLKSSAMHQTNSASALSAATLGDWALGDGLIEAPPLVLEDDNAPVAAHTFENVRPLIETNPAHPQFQTKKEKCWAYISRFVSVAKAERHKFGIPVSITLAQALLESDAGESPLSQRANNHFGIKTFHKKVPHVVMQDDSPHDKFKRYRSAWESFRDHSLLLMRKNYKQLHYLSKNDYIGWAKGLQSAGYATDKHYAAKLIRIVETFQLYKFDEL